MKKLKKLADSQLGLVIIVLGLISLFVPDPLPVIDEALGVVLAFMRYVK